MSPNEGAALAPSDWVLIASITTATLVAVVGWAISYWLNRRLQRRQLTIQILFQHRFDPLFNEAQQRLFTRLRTGTTLTRGDFEQIISKHRDNPSGQSAEDSEFCKDIKLVLNFYEFIAVAVKSGSMDAAVVWHDISSAMEFANKRLSLAIEVIRDLYNDDVFFINFETLMKEWEKKSPAIGKIW